MISFDRSNTNLTAVWKDINSIKSDTSSLYTMITAGGGEGGNKYYLALSDAVNSSLSYVYNMTGNITTFPTYDSFTFHGHIGNLSSLNIDTSIKNFEIGDINVINNLIISGSRTSITYNDIKLIGKTMKSATFRYIMNCGLSFDKILDCSLNSIYYFPVSCNVFSDNTCVNCFGEINAKNISYNSLSINVGFLKCQYFSNNTVIKNNQYINAISISENTFSSISNYELNAKYIYGNSFFCGLGNSDGGCCTPNFICSDFANNTIDNIINNFNINCINCSSIYIHNTTLSGTSTINNSRIININGLDVHDNRITNVYNVNVDCVSLRGRWSLSNINSIKFKAKSAFWAGGRNDHGTTNSMINVGCLDIHEITNGFSIYIWDDNYIGVGTFKLNYNVSWTNPIGGTIQTPLVQTSNFYTLDFYNCDSKVINSIFYIPSYYSGYDEGNVWISGKPLSELGYTLSISS